MWKYLKVNIFLWLWPFPLVFPAPPIYWSKKTLFPASKETSDLESSSPPPPFPPSTELEASSSPPGLPKPGQFRALRGGYLFSPATPGSLSENRLRRFPIIDLPLARWTIFSRYSSFLPFDLNQLDSFDSPSGFHLELPGKHIDQDPVVFTVHELTILFLLGYFILISMFSFFFLIKKIVLASSVTKFVCQIRLSKNNQVFPRRFDESVPFAFSIRREYK